MPKHYRMNAEGARFGSAAPQRHAHPSVTRDRCLELAESRQLTLDNPGLCLACGEEADGCEPDARAYRCEHCGERAVYAPEEILLSWPRI